MHATSLLFQLVFLPCTAYTACSSCPFFQVSSLLFLSSLTSFSFSSRSSTASPHILLLFPPLFPNPPTCSCPASSSASFRSPDTSLLFLSTASSLPSSSFQSSHLPFPPSALAFLCSGSVSVACCRFLQRLRCAYGFQFLHSIRFRKFSN